MEEAAVGKEAIQFILSEVAAIPGAAAQITAQLVQFMESTGKAVRCKASGSGPTSDPQSLIKLLKKNENVCFTEVSSAQYAALQTQNKYGKTLIDETAGIHYYPFSVGERTILMYGENSAEKLYSAITAADGMLGRRSDLSNAASKNAAFWGLSAGKDTFAMIGLSESEAFLLHYVAEENLKKDKKTDLKASFPYCVTELDGSYYATCLGSQEDKLKKNLRMVKAVSYSERSEQILNQVQLKIKNKKIRERSVDEAISMGKMRSSKGVSYCVMDAGALGNRMEVSADQVTLYENNKQVDVFSIADKASYQKAYDLVENMSEPIKGDYGRIRGLTATEQKDYIRDYSREFENLNNELQEEEELLIDLSSLEKTAELYSRDINMEMGYFDSYSISEFAETQKSAERAMNFEGAAR